MIKKKRMVISIVFCDFALWNFDSENFGLVFPKFSFLRQNEAFSATEQNLTYNHSFFFRRLNTIQQEDTPSGQSPSSHPRFKY